MFKVLILSADAGFGHKSAAIAIQEAIKIRYSQDLYTEIINPLDEKHVPNFLRDTQSDYDKWVREVPELYRFGYQASDGAITSTIMESVLTVLLFEALKTIILDFSPQFIVTTYPLYQAPLNAVLAVNNLTIPVMTVMTDISTLHRIWFNTDVDYLVVPNSIVGDLAISYGIEAQKILNFGIPVHPKIASSTKSKKQMRKEFGWEAGKNTILAVGSKRVEHFVEMLDILNHSGFQMQLVIVAGKDQELFKELQETEWHQKTIIYEFVDEMPGFLKAADLILCKAGGLIVTESLASGLPLLLIDVIPGQETGNAEFVVDNKAGFWIKSQFVLLSTICHLFLRKNNQLKEMQTTAYKLGRPEAAFSIAEKIYESVQKIKSLPPIYKERRLTILELLERFQIRIE